PRETLAQGCHGGAGQADGGKNLSQLFSPIEGEQVFRLAFFVRATPRSQRLAGKPPGFEAFIQFKPPALRKVVIRTTNHKVGRASSRAALFPRPSLPSVPPSLLNGSRATATNPPGNRSF